MGEGTSGARAHVRALSAPSSVPAASQQGVPPPATPAAEGHHPPAFIATTEGARRRFRHRRRKPLGTHDRRRERGCGSLPTLPLAEAPPLPRSSSSSYTPRIIGAMGTEVLRPHADCLAARATCRRPLRPAGRRTAAAARHHHHHQGQRHGGARGDITRGPSAAAGMAPRQVRTKVAAEAYAGPAFGAMSPSPRALPLPRFSPRTAAVSEAPGVDDAATRELRRLLGLH